MIAILKKELWVYFGNWSAWFVIAVYSIISALFLFFFDNEFNILEIGTASLQSFFTLSPLLFMFLIPALSMKTLAEEEESGTLVWLFSQPLKISSIVLGKFFSVWLVGCLCLIPSFVYLYTVYNLGVPVGNIDMGMTFGSYIGLVILIAAFSALGILASSATSKQIFAYILGISLNFILYFGIEQLASYKLLGNFDYILQNLGFYHHFIAFSRGLIDSKDLFYFLLIIFLSINLAVFFVKRKK